MKNRKYKYLAAILSASLLFFQTTVPGVAAETTGQESGTALTEADAQKTFATEEAIPAAFARTQDTAGVAGKDVLETGTAEIEDTCTEVTSSSQKDAIEVLEDGAEEDREEAGESKAQEEKPEESKDSEVTGGAEAKAEENAAQAAEHTVEESSEDSQEGTTEDELEGLLDEPDDSDAAKAGTADAAEADSETTVDIADSTTALVVTDDVAGDSESGGNAAEDIDSEDSDAKVSDRTAVETQDSDVAGLDKENLVDQDSDSDENDEKDSGIEDAEEDDLDLSALLNLTDQTIKVTMEVEPEDLEGIALAVYEANVAAGSIEPETETVEMTIPELEALSEEELEKVISYEFVDDDDDTIEEIIVGDSDMNVETIGVEYVYVETGEVDRQEENEEFSAEEKSTSPEINDATEEKFASSEATTAEEEAPASSENPSEEERPSFLANTEESIVEKKSLSEISQEEKPHA